MEKEIKKKEPKDRLVCVIDNEIKIYKDAHQYIVKYKSIPSYLAFFSTIDGCLSDIIRNKQEELIVKNSKTSKDIEMLKKSIDEAWLWFDRVIRPVFNSDKKLDLLKDDKVNVK